MKISARPRNSPTGLTVQPGETYAFAASGRWVDFYIRTDADGYTTAQAPALARKLLKKYETRRRVAEANWFELCGSVGQDGKPFRIGSRNQWTVPAGVSGDLFVWPNDVPGQYWNNWGAIELTITRLAP